MLAVNLQELVKVELMWLDKAVRLMLGVLELALLLQATRDNPLLAKAWVVVLPMTPLDKVKLRDQVLDRQQMEMVEHLLKQMETQLLLLLEMLLLTLMELDRLMLDQEQLLHKDQVMEQLRQVVVQQHRDQEWELVKQQATRPSQTEQALQQPVHQTTLLLDREWVQVHQRILTLI